MAGEWAPRMFQLKPARAGIADRFSERRPGKGRERRRAFCRSAKKRAVCVRDHWPKRARPIDRGGGPDEDRAAPGTPSLEQRQGDARRSGVRPAGQASERASASDRRPPGWILWSGMPGADQLCRIFHQIVVEVIKWEDSACF